MMIDLVYLWVDDNDKEWKFKKDSFLNKPVDKEASDECRFKNNDELKYSLRSVLKNANWINKIFIVTDGQAPSWLDINNPKIRIVDHSEIIPKDKLPVFNSCVIENCIPFIPELSENFLLANDDTFFWNSVSEEFFFLDGKPICRMNAKIKNKEYKHLYGHSIFKAYSLIKETFGKSVPYFSHHNIDAYCKSHYLECMKVFQSEFNETLNHRFRDFNDIQRIIVSYYAIIQEKAIMRNVNVNWLLKLLSLKTSESQYFNLKKSTRSNIQKSKAKLLCINDCRKTTDLDREFMKSLLEKRFPEKSEFEK